MDKDLIRRKALAAAASVTLAFGCRDAIDLEKPVLVVDDSTPVDTDPRGDETAPPDPVEETATLVETDPPGPGAAADCAALGLDMEACCDTLRTWCEGAHAVGSTAYDECVFGPGFSGSTGCIPWGPPVPPRLEVA